MADDVVTGIRVNAKTVDPVAPWKHTVLQPATGKPHVELVGGAGAEARQALDAASATLPGWSETSVPRRAAALRAVAAQLRDESNGEPLAVLISKETGKRIAESRAGEPCSTTWNGSAPAAPSSSPPTPTPSRFDATSSFGSDPAERETAERETAERETARRFPRRRPMRYSATRPSSTAASSMTMLKPHIGRNE